MSLSVIRFYASTYDSLTSWPRISQVQIIINVPQFEKELLHGTWDITSLNRKKINCPENIFFSLHFAYMIYINWAVLVLLDFALILTKCLADKKSKIIGRSLQVILSGRIKWFIWLENLIFLCEYCYVMLLLWLIKLEK